MEPWNDRVQRSKYSKIVRGAWWKIYRKWPKKEWNVLLTGYRLGRQDEKVTRSSGAGIDDVFNSNWEHFQQMSFLESTPKINSPLSTLDKCEITPPASYKSRPSQESGARALINPLPTTKYK